MSDETKSDGKRKGDFDLPAVGRVFLNVSKAGKPYLSIRLDGHDQPYLVFGLGRLKDPKVKGIAIYEGKPRPPRGPA